RRLDRAAVRVDEALGAVEWVREHERGVSDDSCERGLETAGRRRLRKLDDEPRDGRPCTTRAGDAPAGTGYDCGQGGRLAEPEAPVERAGLEEATAERVAERRGDESEIRAAREEHRPRASRPQEAREDERRECERPGEADVDADPVEAVERGTVVPEEQEIARTLRAALRVRVVHQRRQDAEDEQAPGVRDGERGPLQPRAEPCP